VKTFQGQLSQLEFEKDQLLIRVNEAEEHDVARQEDQPDVSDDERAEPEEVSFPEQYMCNTGSVSLH